MFDSQIVDAGIFADIPKGISKNAGQSVLAGLEHD